MAKAQGEAAKSARQLVIDFNLLRAGGYLPEAGQDRQFADQYRQIKRQLIRKALSGKTVDDLNEKRLIMVSSALPGDGKTFTSINLSLSMARERDVSILLMDVDLPKPHVSKIFGLQNEPGLLDALVDDTVSVESLIIPTTVSGLSILPAGTPTEGMSELLSSDRMRQIVATLCAPGLRRIVILDSPPLLVTSEARALISLAGQIVLVVRAGKTPQHAVTDAVGLLPASQPGGLILNEAKMGVMERYYGYGYGKYGITGDDLDSKG